jgi:sialidase-1
MKRVGLSLIGFFLLLNMAGEGENTSFKINEKEIYTSKTGKEITGSIALLPGINTMKDFEFESPGQTVPGDSLNYLFESGTSGYKTFRIPAIVSSVKGTILAFAEGRKNGSSDTGDIDLVLKRSEDNGKTWSNLMVVWDDGENVCGNPAPVVEKSSETIFLLSTWNLGTDHEPEIIKQTSKDSRRIFILSSTDDGKTWTPAAEITSSVKLNNWTWYATGPCHGIQLEKGKNKGRLIIPCDHIESITNKYYSHIIYSDDHGKKWQTGGTTPQDQVNECTVAELSDGRLLLNMRNYDRSEKSRKVAASRDAGLTWNDIYSDKTLIEPICQGSLLQYSFADEGKNRLLFLNPADADSRQNMTLRLSADEGLTWTKSMVLFGGPSAYSDLTRLPNGNIGCLYEAGYLNPYQGIIYKEVSLSELEK